MFVAGDRVEIIDPSHRLYRLVGSVDFAIGDNIYVRFPKRRWRAVRVFFPQQLRRAKPQASLLGRD